MYVKIGTNWYIYINIYIVLTLSKLVVHCTVNNSTTNNFRSTVSFDISSIRNDNFSLGNFEWKNDFSETRIGFTFTLTSHIEITKKEFEDSSEDLLKRIESKIKEFLNFSEIKNQAFNKIILVGGSSRIPLFRELIYQITKKWL